MKWGTGATFIDLGLHIQANTSDVTYPFLIIHDPGDKICPISGSYKLYKDSKTIDKNKKLLEVECFCL